MSTNAYNPRAKSKFLLVNLLKGLIWLVTIIVGYVLATKYLGFDLQSWMGPLYENALAIYLIFLTSEVVFGIIPPEFFMIWSLREGDLIIYAQHVAGLALISYLAGIFGFFIGVYFDKTRIYRLLRRRILGKYHKLFNQYGGFLIIVAALTPLPFSGICMLVGSVRYPFRKFAWIALVRFLRFGVYAWFVWQALMANPITDSIEQLMP